MWIKQVWVVNFSITALHYVLLVQMAPHPERILLSFGQPLKSESFNCTGLKGIIHQTLTLSHINILGFYRRVEIHLIDARYGPNVKARMTKMPGPLMWAPPIVKLFAFRNKKKRREKWRKKKTGISIIPDKHTILGSCIVLLCFVLLQWVSTGRNSLKKVEMSCRNFCRWKLEGFIKNWMFVYKYLQLITGSFVH